MRQHWAQPGLELASDREPASAATSGALKSLKFQGSDVLPFSDKSPLSCSPEHCSHSLPLASTWVTAHSSPGPAPAGSAGLHLGPCHSRACGHQVKL